MEGLEGIECRRLGRPPLGDQVRKQISVRLSPEVYDALRTHSENGFGQELDKILREHYGIAHQSGS